MSCASNGSDKRHTITLQNMEFLARVVQRSRATASRSALHMEAKASEEFLLPSTCTRRDDWTSPSFSSKGRQIGSYEPLPSLQPGTCYAGREQQQDCRRHVLRFQFNQLIYSTAVKSLDTWISQASMLIS